MSVNRVILVGHLGADPEVRATPGGMQVANLRLATNHVSYDKDGNGSQIYVEGRLRTNKYTDRDGIERYQTEVVGERMQMLGGRDDSKLTVLRRAFELARNNVRY